MGLPETARVVKGAHSQESSHRQRQRGENGKQLLVMSRKLCS